MNMKSFPIQDWLQQNTIINVSGTMTALGASMVPEEIRQCVDESLGRFVNMDALQAEASTAPSPNRPGLRRVVSLPVWLLEFVSAWQLP